MIGSWHEAYPQCSIRRRCRLLVVAPSSYYYAGQEADDRELRDHIERLALEFPRECPLAGGTRSSRPLLFPV